MIKIVADSFSVVAALLDSVQSGQFVSFEEPNSALTGYFIADVI